MVEEINMAAKFVSASVHSLKFFFWINFLFFSVAQSNLKWDFTIHRRMFPEQRNTWIISSKRVPFAFVGGCKIQHPERKLSFCHHVKTFNGSSISSI